MSFDKMLNKIAPIIAEYEEASGNIVSCRISDLTELGEGDVMWYTGHLFYKGRLDRITDEQYKLLKSGVPL